MKNSTITLSKVFLSATICGLLLTFGACKNEAKPEDPKEVAEDQNEAKFDENDAKEDDSEFLVAAAEINMMEIELGKLAQSKSTNPSIKKHAEMYITDHTKAAAELKPFAEKRNISLPTALTEKGQEHFDELNKLSGKDFDKKYAEMMFDGHQEAVTTMERAAENATDPEIKAWAANMVPTLKSHLEHAKMLKEEVNK